MTVDRSYSEYEAIRNYQDRGMMKWGAFATGELTDAQKTEKIDSLTIPLQQTQTKEEILQALISSWTNKQPITLNLMEDKKAKKIVGQVVDVVDRESFRLNDETKQRKIRFVEISGVKRENEIDRKNSNGKL